MYPKIKKMINDLELRVSEVINLRISDIISKEMKIRIRNGKRNKERYTLLSQKNLEILVV